MDNSLINEIEGEFKRIEADWLSIHFKLSIGVAILAFLLECGIGKIMHDTGDIDIPLELFILKYLIIPVITNSVLVLLCYFVYYSKKISQISKIYMISIAFVLISFVVFVVHGFFYSLYIIFALPALLTSVYSNYKLTTITAVLGIIGLFVAVVFIQWDKDKVSIFENGVVFSNFLISVVVLIVFDFFSLTIIFFEKQKNVAALKKEMERQELKHKLRIDELTKAYNRKALRSELNDIEEDYTLTRYVYVMCDLDNFKLLNDTYGHIEGDYCLVELVKICKKCCGLGNVYRYGGDEFALLFKDISVEEVYSICEEIQKEFTFISKKYSTHLPLTLSFGIAEHQSNMAPSRLIKNSDRALYQSKKKKNRITVYRDVLKLKEI